jgi:hypothetical protein
VIVAVYLAEVMEATIDSVVHVIALRNGFVAAVRPVLVRPIVRVAGMRRRAFRRVRLAHVEAVLVDVPTGAWMQS